MIEPVTIQFHKGTPAAVIHLQISRDKMKEFMGPAIQEITRAVTAQGIGPAGPLFAHHLTMSDTLFDFEVGFPVSWSQSRHTMVITRDFIERGSNSMRLQGRN